MRARFLYDSLPEHSLPAGGEQLALGPAVLLVDSDPEMLTMLRCYFEQRGFHVATVNTFADAKTFFSRRAAWTLVVSDYHLPDGTGAALHAWLRARPGPTPPVLLMSGSMYGAALC